METMMTQTGKEEDGIVNAAEAAFIRKAAGLTGTDRTTIVRWSRLEKDPLHVVTFVNGDPALPLFRRADVLAFVAPSERTDEPQPTTTTEDT